MSSSDHQKINCTETTIVNNGSREESFDDSPHEESRSKLTSGNYIRKFALDEILEQRKVIIGFEDAPYIEFIYYFNGNTYEGETHNGMLHGKGKFTWAETGATYSGQFVNNEISGYGRIDWPDGSFYQGDVFRGVRHGNGTYSHPAGITYVGQWRNGKKHGEGRLQYSPDGGSFYEGHWQDGVREGYGVYQYPEGATYEGEWAGGKRHGEGTMHWSDRDEIYTGGWKDGQQHGLGCHAWHILRVRTSQYSLPNVYDGQWENGKRNGLGTFHYPNGSKYVGYWKNDFKHGRFFSAISSGLDYRTATAAYKQRDLMSIPTAFKSFSKGTIILKDGRIFERTFIDDRPVPETSSLSEDENKQLGLDRLNTRLPPLKESTRMEDCLSDTSDSNLLEHYIKPHISEAHYNQLEMRTMQNYITANLAELRCIYHFYGKLGMDSLPDNTIVMRYIQFCEFIKDCHLHQNTSLAALDRIIAISYSNDEADQIQNPERLISFGTFVNILVILACNLYTQEETEIGTKVERSRPSDALTCLISQAILPNACRTTSLLYSDPEKTKEIMVFMEPAYHTFQLLTRARTKPGKIPSTLTMRQLILIFRDFDMLDEKMTVTDVVKTLCKNNPNAGPYAECNMDTEITYFDYFEALVHCALLPLTKLPAPSVVVQEPVPSVEPANMIASPVPAETPQRTRASSVRPQKTAAGKKSREKRRKTKDDPRPENVAPAQQVDETIKPQAEDIKLDEKDLVDKTTVIETVPEVDEFTQWKTTLQEFFVKKFFPAVQQFEIVQQRLMTADHVSSDNP